MNNRRFVRGTRCGRTQTQTDGRTSNCVFRAHLHKLRLIMVRICGVQYTLEGNQCARERETHSQLLGSGIAPGRAALLLTISKTLACMFDGAWQLRSRAPPQSIGFTTSCSCVSHTMYTDNTLRGFSFIIVWQQHTHTPTIHKQLVVALMRMRA